MGFFKELIDAAKEGIEEGKEELAQEKAEEKRLEQEGVDALKAQVNGIDYDEQFGVALAAPFRAVLFADWFSLFKSSREDRDEDEYPLHLYACGEQIDLSDSDVKNMAHMIKRDFGATNKDTAMAVIGDIFELYSISTKVDFPPSDDMSRKEIRDYQNSMAILKVEIDDELHQKYTALAIIMVAFLITCSTDLGYIEKPLAMLLLKDLSKYTKSLYKGKGSWKTLGEDFLEGESIAQLNGKKGRKELEKYVGYLNFKAGSPWNNIEFNCDEDELIDIKLQSDFEIVHISMDEEKIKQLITEEGDYFQVIEPVVLSVDLGEDDEDYNEELTKFSLPQRYVFAINCYIAEVNNGGHDQFFYNSAGVVWEDAIDAFKAIGALTNYEIIKESVDRLGGSPSKDWEKRQEQLEAADADFDDLDDRHYDSEATMIKKLNEYILVNAKDFCFDSDIIRTK